MGDQLFLNSEKIYRCYTLHWVINSFWILLKCRDVTPYTGWWTLFEFCDNTEMSHHILGGKLFLKSVKIMWFHTLQWVINSSLILYKNLKQVVFNIFPKHLFKTSFENTFYNIFSKPLLITSFQNFFSKHLFKTSSQNILTSVIASIDLLVLFMIYVSSVHVHQFTIPGSCFLSSVRVPLAHNSQKNTKFFSHVTFFFYQTKHKVSQGGVLWWSRTLLLSSILLLFH